MDKNKLSAPHKMLLLIIQKMCDLSKLTLYVSTIMLLLLELRLLREGGKFIILLWLKKNMPLFFLNKCI